LHHAGERVAGASDLGAAPLEGCHAAMGTML
jgi:hypothetical protein